MSCEVWDMKLNRAVRSILVNGLREKRVMGVYTHHDNSVQSSLPVLFHDTFSILPEKFNLLPSRCLFSASLCLDELLGFGEEQTGDSNAEGQTCTDKKEGLPALGRIGDDV